MIEYVFLVCVHAFIGVSMRKHFTPPHVRDNTSVGATFPRHAITGDHSE